MPSATTAMRLERFGLKFFVAGDDASLDLAAAISIFHRWIQSGRLDGLLIDVADYRHVPDGPGVMLIGHEADYSLDRTEGPLGLLCNLKRPGSGNDPDRLREALVRALAACRLLEEEPEFEKRGLKFRGRAFRILLNDRLASRNDDATLDGLRPDLEAALRFSGAGSPPRLERVGSDARDRLGIDVRLAEALDVESLLARLRAAARHRPARQRL